MVLIINKINSQTLLNLSELEYNTKLFNNTLNILSLYKMFSGDVECVIYVDNVKNYGEAVLVEEYQDILLSLFQMVTNPIFYPTNSVLHDEVPDDGSCDEEKENAYENV